MSRTTRLPATGPLARLAGDVKILAKPSAPRRPWVVATSERVLKAYDLSHFDAIDRARVIAEAETAMTLGDLDGVVTTHGFEEVAGWLTIEMERLGETLAEYLRAVEERTRVPLSPGSCGALIESVATTLGEVHRRRLVHRDVKPANLIFDRSGRRLLVADFSLAKRRPRRGGGAAGVAGTRSYIAPEVFRGQVGPAADQYGLGVTAGEMLGDAATVAAQPVLLRATERDPDDRYPSIADFGLALRAALDDAAPRRVSSRLQRVSVKWRQTWAAGAAAFAATYTWLLWSRRPALSWEDGLVLPLLAMGLTMVATRMLNPLRGGRSRPRLAIADRGWFPILPFAIAIAATSPLLSDDPSQAGRIIAFAGFGSLALAAVLGSQRPGAGDWLIRLVRRWESRRESQRRRPVRWWGGRLAIAAALALFAALPYAVAERWPGATPATPAEGAPVALVVKLRTALLRERWDIACALTRIPPVRQKARCREWAPVAGRWLRADRRRGAAALDERGLAELRLTGIPDAARISAPLWRIRDDDNLDLGTIEQQDENGRVWEVTVERGPPIESSLEGYESLWNYEVVKEDGSWWVTSVEACDFAADPACVRLSQTDRSELEAVARRG